ncbi:MAG: hypothetical protein JRI36_12305, partial [Deltaproteobacteria bacterium]|nr:hypothetical protein [Deltaproteobacteria bacterium]
SERRLKKYGKNLTKYVTLPLTAIGIGMIKLASDAEEIDSKFAVTFRNVQKSATDAMNQLDRAYGVNATEAKKLLSSTGDLLSGFGFAQEEALTLSLGVQKLAVDLASFQNLQGGATRASEALTKALLGERESAKLLGIVIREEDVQARILVNQKMGVTHATKNQAKAYATLQIAMEQSKNAIGDYARTQESFANQWREFIFDLKDLGETFGKILLPIASKFLSLIRKMLGWIQSLDEATKKWVLILGAAAAILGPLTLIMTMFLGLMIKLLVVLVSFGPAIIVFTAIATAVWAIVDAFTEADLGIINFFRNIRIGGTSLGAWLDALGTYIWQTWEWTIDKSILIWETFWVTVKELGAKIKRVFLRMGQFLDDVFWIAISSITRGLASLLRNTAETMSRVKGMSQKVVNSIIESAASMELKVSQASTKSAASYKKAIEDSLDESAADWKKYYAKVTKLDEDNAARMTKWAKARQLIFGTDQIKARQKGEAGGAGATDITGHGAMGEVAIKYAEAANVIMTENQKMANQVQALAPTFDQFIQGTLGGIFELATDPEVQALGAATEELMGIYQNRLNMLQSYGEAHKEILKEIAASSLTTQEKSAQREIALQNHKNAVILAGVGSLLSLAASALTSGGKKNFKLYKLLAQGEATIATYQAYNKALASGPGPPYTIPLAASILGLGLMKVRQIGQMKPGGGFSGGGGGGRGGGFNASPKAITPPEELTTTQEAQKPQDRYTIIIENVNGTADDEFADKLAESLYNRSVDGREFGFETTSR